MREAIPVVVLGSAARRVLADPGEGRVLAVFERAFYLEGRGGLICLGPVSLGAGPLNLLCADWRPSEAAPGMLARLSGAEIRLAGGPAFSLARAIDWRPPRPPEWHVAHLRRGLAALARAAARRAPRDGLGRLIPALVDGEQQVEAADAASPLLRRAAAGASALAGWLARNDARPPPARARALIGLGPGLTPSGDDLIAGALIALRTFLRPTRPSSWVPGRFLWRPRGPGPSAAPTWPPPPRGRGRSRCTGSWSRSVRPPRLIWSANSTPPTESAIARGGTPSPASPWRAPPSSASRHSPGPPRQRNGQLTRPAGG